MWVWPPHGLPDAADHLEQTPQRDTGQMWVRGVLVAAVPAVYGIRCLLSGETTIIGRHGWLTITGSASVAFAVAFISLACWLHFQYFWTNHQRLWRYSELGKLAAIAAFSGSLIFGCISLIVFG